MAAQQPARGGARRESIDEFMARRRRELEGFGRDAEAAAHAAVAKAIRLGEDLRLPTQSDVVSYGRSLLGSKPAKAPIRSAQPTVTAAPAKRSALDDSRAAKAVGGTLAFGAGLAPGAARGLLHTVEGANDGAQLVLRLANPLDRFISPPGQSAAEQVVGLGRKVADYTKRASEDPSIVRHDLATAVQDFRVKHDPTATPVADTMGGEMKRAFNLGMNDGELVFDVGSTLVGGEAIRGAAGLGRAAKAAGATERAYFAANPGAAEAFARPYPKTGMSHHIVARDAELPKWLGGGPYPERFIENEFNKIRHDGLSYRDLYRNHVGVDDRYYGGKIPAEFGGGTWSATRDLGWDRYGFWDRLNYGTSPSTKAVVGPVLVGGVADDALRPDEEP